MDNRLVKYQETLNPVMKLVAVFPPMIILMFVRDVWTSGSIVAVLAFVLVLMYQPKPIVAVKYLFDVSLAFIWFSLLFSLFTVDNSADQEILLVAGPIVLTSTMLSTGVATVFRMSAIFLLAIIGSVGISSRNLTSSLVRQCRVPYRYAYGAVASLRFIPVYRNSAEQIRLAHRVRGLQEKPGPVGFVRRTGKQAVPLLAGGVRHAERLSLAMDSRGFGFATVRTDRDPAKVRIRDWGVVLAIWGMVTLVFIGTYYFGSLQFGGLMQIQ